MSASTERRRRNLAVLGGRRETDPILDLETETRPFLTLSLLAKYFMVDRRFLVDCVNEGLLKAHTLKGSEWRVKLIHARTFERSQIHPTTKTAAKRSSAEQ